MSCCCCCDFPPLFYERYSIGAHLGSGAFAEVYECFDRATGKKYAVKRIDKEMTGMHHLSECVHEINMMEAVAGHPNVIRLIEYFNEQWFLYIILECLEGGELFEMLCKLKHFSEQIASRLIQNFLLALQHCHARGIMHRDLKLENLLLKRKEPGRDDPDPDYFLTDFVIADFGLAARPPGTSCCGSPPYMAPEVVKAGYDVFPVEGFSPSSRRVSSVVSASNLDQLESFDEKDEKSKDHIPKDLGVKKDTEPFAPQQESPQLDSETEHEELWQSADHIELRTPSSPMVESYDEKCDIFSVGVVAYILLSGNMPFTGDKPDDVMLKILHQDYNHFTGEPWESAVSEDAKDFIKLLLRPKPRRRPTATEALKHPWIAKLQSNDDKQELRRQLVLFNARRKLKVTMQVFRATAKLFGKHLDRTPPFIKYLRHKQKLSTVIEAQSQKDPEVQYKVDFGAVLSRDSLPDWKLQSICSCNSELVCHHIENVHEYLFEGRREIDVIPFFYELESMQKEAHLALLADPEDRSAAEKAGRLHLCILAAEQFHECYMEVKDEDMTLNPMVSPRLKSKRKKKAASQKAKSVNLASYKSVALPN